MTNRLSAAVLVLALAGLALPGPASAAPRVYRGAQAGAPVKPTDVEVDLRDLPVEADWRPGDPIDERPRQALRPSPQSGRVPGAPEPDFDPSLAMQDEAASGGPDLTFLSPILNFAGQAFTGVNPPDTVGDVGPRHYIQMINASGGARFVVYDKSGTLVAGPSMLDALGTGDCANGLGSGVVLWDPLADRWLLSELSGSGNRLCVYVSRSADPVSGGWWAYSFQAPSFPDYPKYGVWPDAYYVGSSESSPAVYALDRARMLSGQAASFQRFTAPALARFEIQMLLPADLDGDTPPPPGAPGLFMRHRDDELHNVGSNDPTRDFLELWQFHVDWAAPANSTFTGPTNIVVSEFDSAFCCFPQPGTNATLDPMNDVLMHRLQYRNFGTHESLVGNLVTDVNGADRGGIRWFEVRRIGSGGFTLGQNGTYSPDATNRWMGSAAMDKDGNLAVGYSVSSSSVSPGIRYAGRLRGDPEGSLPQGEGTVKDGSGFHGSGRWGFYSALSVDPADECTFWFTTMYNLMSTWATQIATFRFESCGEPPDFAVSASPSSVTITQGGSADTAVTVTSLSGFGSSVSLNASGLPAGVTASFSPASLTPHPNGTAASVLTLTASPTATMGSVSVTISGVSGLLTRTATVRLRVDPDPRDLTAAFDPVLRAPKCGSVGRSCDTGPGLVRGRAGLGPEPNQPNTINAACPDGTAGAFHSDESNDRLRVVSVDGTNFVPGTLVRVEASVWAWVSFAGDKLDLYYAADANSPVWTLIATLTPTAAGPQTLAATYSLPTGSMQAVRAQFRYGGGTSACSSGPYNDRDDLVFAVSPPPDFSVSASPSSLSIAQGERVDSTVSVTSLNDFSSSVSLSASGLPSGVTASFSPASVTVPANGTATSIVTFTALPTAARGPVSVSISGVAGPAARTTTVSLRVDPGDRTAVFDGALRAPKCGSAGRSCDSGPSLLSGRASLGPEPNQPNTIDSCPDGTAGAFHRDESLDRLRVSTSDGTALAGGKTVRIDAAVWAWSNYGQDRLDLYHAADANHPIWVFVTTLTPTGANAQTLSANYTLPPGPLQVVRGRFRYQGTATTCSTDPAEESYDDQDDLIFAVE